jgi:hypothetical protein
LACENLRLYERLETLVQCDFRYTATSGDRESEIREDVVRSGGLRNALATVNISPNIPHLVARQALHPIPKLSLEVIHHDAVIGHAIDLPFAFRRDLLRLCFQRPFPFRSHFDYVLGIRTIEVLM